MNKLKSNYNNQTFEEIRHVNEEGEEYWYAKHVKTAVLGHLIILSAPTKWLP